MFGFLWGLLRPFLVAQQYGNHGEKGQRGADGFQVMGNLAKHLAPLSGLCLASPGILPSGLGIDGRLPVLIGMEAKNLTWTPTYSIPCGLFV